MQGFASSTKAPYGSRKLTQGCLAEWSKAPASGAGPIRARVRIPQHSVFLIADKITKIFQKDISTNTNNLHIYKLPNKIIAY